MSQPLSERNMITPEQHWLLCTLEEYTTIYLGQKMEWSTKYVSSTHNKYRRFISLFKVKIHRVSLNR